MSGPIYTASEGVVWKEPVETKHPDGTSSFTLGFRVCTMSPDVGGQAAEAVARLMNAGEVAPALLAALQEIAADSKDATDPELTSECSWGNNDDVFSDGLRQGRYCAAAVARAAIAKATGQGGAA